jgi:septal ring factor EnvC (AmiA/AmiB activator)
VQPIEFQEGEDMAKTLKAQKKAEQQEFESYKKAQSDHKKLFGETQALEKKIAQVCKSLCRVVARSPR